MIKPSLKISILFLLLIPIFSSCSKTEIETKNNFEVVEFPDGSVAFLNHNSSIAYENEFNPRNVNLQGEAFFTVTKGESPFIVTTELGNITVLGTEFNVKSNEDELDVEVEHGEVKVKTKEAENKIGRGKSAKYKKGNSKIKIGKAQLKFKLWLNDLKIEWKKLGKEVDYDSKQINKDFKEMSKGIKKEIKRLKIK